jgi:homoserine O-acetyltransferase
MTHATLGSETGRGRSVGRVRTARVRLYTEADPLVLGEASLAPVDVAYETYGDLAPDGGNAIVVCHALTGDAHAAGQDDAGAAGWWETMIGPGRPLDTDAFFVVCSNLLGGCKGTTGPWSTDPRTEKPYGLRFPMLGVSDLVTVQRRLLHSLGVERPYAAIGGSLGGMQVLQWALDHPGELERAVMIGVAPRLTAQNIAFSAVARASIMRDEHFCGGDYYGSGSQPAVGLAVARMLGHITYLSGQALELKFGRDRRNGGGPTLEPDFEVESYLDYQAAKFLERFDANSYLYLSRAMDYFDPFADEAAAVEQLSRGETRYLLVSFDSDWRFPTAGAREIAGVIQRARRPVRLEEIHAPWGHDSFLLPVPEYLELVQAFLRKAV